MNEAEQIYQVFQKKYGIGNKELEKLKENVENGKEISSLFEPSRAKDISEILWIERSKDKSKWIKNKTALNLYVECEKYFEDKSVLNLILGEGALEPEGMLVPVKNNEKLIYESLY